MRPAPRPAAGESVAGGGGLRGGFVLLAAKVGDARLRIAHQFFQPARALLNGLPVQIGGLCALAMVQSFLEQLLFLLFVAPHAFNVMRERLFRLRLISVQARQFLAEFGGRAAQRGYVPFGGIVGP